MMLDVWNVGRPIAVRLEQYLALLCAGGVGMLHTNYAKGVLPSLQETVTPFLVTFLTIIKYQLCYLLSASSWSCPWKVGNVPCYVVTGLFGGRLRSGIQSAFMWVRGIHPTLLFCTPLPPSKMPTKCSVSKATYGPPYSAMLWFCPSLWTTFKKNRCSDALILWLLIQKFCIVYGNR